MEIKVPADEFRKALDVLEELDPSLVRSDWFQKLVEAGNQQCKVERISDTVPPSLH